MEPACVIINLYQLLKPELLRECFEQLRTGAAAGIDKVSKQAYGENLEKNLAALTDRLRRCKLQVHPEKTKVVYCKDDDRTGAYPQENFDFLGFCFRPRPSKNRWDKFFVNFSPGASPKALKRIGEQLRDWRIHRKSDKSLDDIARMFNATIRGWIAYYGHYYKSALYPVLRRLNRYLVRWAQQKYKRLKHQRRATHWLRRIAWRNPQLFAHWRLGLLP